ncbi:MAG: mannose-6-phosphate isomerase [Planctomycetaceae bacterium]|nr:mannose-6-phosphate isomerase [Planctomycetaceae bacterium]
MSALLEPLRFERIFLEKVWGGRNLERCLGLDLPPEVPVGETWEIVDRADHVSRVAVGPHAGRTLDELMRAHRADLLGKAPATADGRFPLLVKYLDAKQPLSVQVHPDDRNAARIGRGAEGKTEAWYFLDAEPGGSVWCGLAPGVDRQKLASAVGTGVLLELLTHHPVVPGTSLTVPGGTVHAIGAGVTLLEVQQNSDTTYRLYDWDRPGLDGTPRAMHLEEGLAAAQFGAMPLPPVEPDWHWFSEGARRAPMSRSAHFGMNRFEIEAPTRLSTGDQFQIYAVVEGKGRLSVKSSGAELDFVRGDVLLVPAAAGYHVFEPAAEPLGLVQLLHRA